MKDENLKGQRCSYECRDVGFDCDWRCVAEDEEQLIEKVKQHANKYHSIWNANEERISEYVKKPTGEM